MMDEFDYLNGTLTEWLELLEGKVGSFDDTIAEIESEYLPRFEAALHKNNARKASV